MNTYTNPSPQTWAELCTRPSSDNPAVRERVEKIIERVREGGDKALKEIALEIDHAEMEAFEVTPAEFEEAAGKVSQEVKDAIKAASANILAFHQAQMPGIIEVETTAGVKCWQKPVAIGRVGLYIPGGTAPLFSTVLMLALPAKVAGCREVILCTPARDGKVSSEVLYAAKECGITRVFKVGGAQAVAAMAFGTGSIPKVDKIFGPGNQYVTTAKQLLGNKKVAIDMPAGPSEVMVMADSSAVPSYVAADLLSQAEHGADSQVMLVCNSKAVADSVFEEVGIQAAKLDRSAFVESALSKSRIVIFDSVDDMIAFANEYGSEHLIISMKNPWDIAGRITSAGSVFIGNFSPESAGDYASGTNHTLPTCGWAHSCSGVNIDSFMRKITFQELSQEGLASLSKTIVSMAEAEGLAAHANAVKVRTAK